MAGEKKGGRNVGKGFGEGEGKVRIFFFFLSIGFLSMKCGRYEQMAREDKERYAKELNFSTTFQIFRMEQKVCILSCSGVV
jgi:hypothetical protein